MDQRDESAEVVAGERRDDRRKATRCRVELAVETHTLAGETQNLSGAGVFLFSDTPLRVRVTLERDGETEHRSGRLVRVERMNAESTGYAVEFDGQ